MKKNIIAVFSAIVFVTVFIVAGFFVHAQTAEKESTEQLIERLLQLRLKKEIALQENELLGFSGNVATLSTPTTTQATGAATGSLFIGSLLPDRDNLYDLGTTGNSWRNAVIDGSIISAASSTFRSSLHATGNLNASSTAIFGSFGRWLSSNNQRFEVLRNAVSSSLRSFDGPIVLSSASGTYHFTNLDPGYNTTTIYVTSTAPLGGTSWVGKNTAGQCVEMYVNGTTLVIEQCSIWVNATSTRN